MRGQVGDSDSGMLAATPDDHVFEEAARRLKRAFLKRTGVDFRHGHFEFLFHDGRFQGIEEHYRARPYLSPGRSGRIC